MKRRNFLIYIFLVILFTAFITNTDRTIAAVRDALCLNAQTVIPSLFPFFVFSSLMINTGFVTALGKIFSPVAKRIFKTDGNGAVVFVMGVLCGYPTGAKMVAELYINKMMDKPSSERLLPFCNNSGPVFVIGAVGGMLGDVSLGVKLYIIHVISAFVTGIIMSIGAKFPQKRKTEEIYAVNLGKAISNSVCTATKTMLNVCGYIAFFAVLNSFIIPIVQGVAGKSLLGIFISGLTEVTLGVKSIISEGMNIETTLVLISGALGFGGLCVFLQVTGIVSEVGLSSKKYVFGKSIQMTISMLISKIVFTHVDLKPAFLTFGEITQKYVDSAPIILFGFLIALIYYTARRN